MVSTFSAVPTTVWLTLVLATSSSIYVDLVPQSSTIVCKSDSEESTPAETKGETLLFPGYNLPSGGETLGFTTLATYNQEPTQHANTTRQDAIADDSSDEQHNHWNGISHGNQDAEYEGEAVVATVTVVDDFDPTELTHGPSPSTSKSQTLGDPSHGAASSSAATRSSRSEKRQPQSTSTDRSKHTAQTATSPSNPKKIKYETNAARKSQRMKQRARRTEKAERAGGKASRKRATNTKGKKRR
ncbi:hypothetical protein ONZ45_g14245 [Pleurotus djamor]|nr:hypothetical protein ONZ45_g14245 [Pleurotus djamor]